MLDKIAALPALSRNRTAAGRIARMEERIDLLTKLLANLTGGLGISVHLSPRNVIEISAAGGDGDGESGVNMAWAATLAGTGADRTVRHRGGTVTFFGGGATTFADAEEEIGGDDACCYLYWDASYNNGAGRWQRLVQESYPESEDMDDGDVFIPLWKVEDGELTQETLGAIVIPAVKNVVDRAEYT